MLCTVHVIRAVHAAIVADGPAAAAKIQKSAFSQSENRQNFQIVERKEAKEEE